jgi:ketosteroid isomerase-like protein
MRHARTVILMALGGWLVLTAAPSAQPAAADAAGLPALLLATTDRWNAGDLDGFIAPYAEDTTFMTPGGLIGRDAMRTRYQTRYFTGSRPDQQLRFEQLAVTPLGDRHALMTGRFVLSGGGKPEQSGRFTLVWAHTAAGWRIVHDHSS